MSNNSDDYTRGERTAHRQAHENPGLAVSPDSYHVSFHETANVRQLPVYRSLNDSNHHRISNSYEASNSRDYSPSSYDRTDSYHQHSIYNVNNQYLPPLPPSPNHYIIDSEEPFIPPPDSYLSPPGPAPPDRFQSEAKTTERFLHTDTDFYLSSASCTVDRCDRSNIEQIYRSYSAANKYRNAPSSESSLERYTDYYQTLPYSDSARNSYQKRDLDYPNYCPSLSSSHYHQKADFSLPTNKRILWYNQCQNVRFQKCCDIPLSSRDTAQTYDLSARTRTRIRSRRTSSPPVSLLTTAVPATVPVDFTNSSVNNGRYLSSFSSTLSRCNSFSDVESHPSPIETIRKVSVGHENCCYKRHISSSPSSIGNPHHSAGYSTTVTTAPVSSTMSTSSSAYFQQPLTSLNSTWWVSLSLFSITNFLQISLIFLLIIMFPISLNFPQVSFKFQIDLHQNFPSFLKLVLCFPHIAPKFPSYFINFPSPN